MEGPTRLELRPPDWYGSEAEFTFQQQQEREQFGWIALARRAVSDDPRLYPGDITDGNRPLATAFFRELVPNPFRSQTWNPNWSVSTTCELARHIYTDRNFSAMPILADALQDAGCENACVLDHCRANRVHARGCWVLDALLGKS